MIKNLNLDDQNFDIIVENARKAIRKYAPYWTDENAHDPGITMIELFAWLKEMLQYYMDQTTEPLEYQFLKLFGIRRDFGSPASVIAKVTQLNGSMEIPFKTQFTKGRFTFETIKAYKLDPSSISDVFVEDDHGKLKSVYKVIDNGLTIYPFGKTPTANKCLYIEFDAPHMCHQAYELYIQMFEDYEVKRNPIIYQGSKTDFIPLSQVEWCYKNAKGEWSNLQIIKDETYGLLNSGLLTYILDEENPPSESVFQLRCRLIAEQYDVSPRIVDIFNRIVSLKQTNTIPMLQFDSTGFPNQSIELPYEDVYYPSLVVEVFDPLLNQWEKWEAVDALHEVDKEALAYAYDPQNHSIIFGDNKNGRIPEKGNDVIRVQHLERSLLEHGNIAVDVLTSIDGEITISCLTNATGGRPIKSLDKMKAELYHQMNHTSVAVTDLDYEMILKQTPGLMIETTKCLPLYRPGLQDYPNKLADNEVSVLVVPYSQRRLNKGYIQNLRKEVEKHRMITTEVHILNPVYYDIGVYMELKSSLDHKVMEKLVESTIKSNYVYDFGQNISKSQFYKILTEIEGIESIHSIRLSSLQPLSRTKLGDIEIPPYGIGDLQNIEIVWLED